MVPTATSPKNSGFGFDKFSTKTLIKVTETTVKAFRCELVSLNISVDSIGVDIISREVIKNLFR